MTGNKSGKGEEMLRFSVEKVSLEKTESKRHEEVRRRRGGRSSEG